ncbi:MAG: hypothetical protein HY669_00600 [Chloroflexi bacterium]|nr:hypothetical protein [Chloroflexota bacterium]
MDKSKLCDRSCPHCTRFLLCLEAMLQVAEELAMEQSIEAAIQEALGPKNGGISFNPNG